MTERIHERWQALPRPQSINKRLVGSLTAFSLLVILVVFWWLKLVGITLTGDAFCGKEEHIHDDACLSGTVCAEDHEHTDACGQTEYLCGKEAHTHTAACYSDLTADLETLDDWEGTLAGISLRPSAAENTVAVARSQIGYKESTRNYVVDPDGALRGYTRYGEWYGNPYGDWSTMFVSFCLHYGGVTDAPMASGAQAMLLAWQEKEQYYPVGTYRPVSGDVVFLDVNRNGTPEKTAIVSAVGNDGITVIEGDHDGGVAEVEYFFPSEYVVGYAAPSPGNNLLVLDTDPTSADTVIANTVTYTESMLADNLFILYTQGSDGNYYAMDGNGGAVRIDVSAAGEVTSSLSDPTTLYWAFAYQGTYQKPDNSYGTQSAYYIQNVATAKYLHPCDGTTSVISGKWESGLFPQGEGARIRGARQNYYSYLQNDTTFANTTAEASGTVFLFAKAPTQYAVWLDGTQGGIMALGGSDNLRYLVSADSRVILPTQWKSPEKYDYKLQGWYDVKVAKYYLPGSEITVTESTVLYADWVASTYDIGQYNSFVSDTVSTKDFLITQVFDFSTLFNLQSLTPTVSVNAGSHSESWSLVTDGTVPYGG